MMSWEQLFYPSRLIPFKFWFQTDLGWELYKKYAVPFNARWQKCWLVKKLVRFAPKGPLPLSVKDYVNHRRDENLQRAMAASYGEYSCQIDFNWNATASEVYDARTYIGRRKKVALCVRNLAH
jgi:hypothetical protein